MARPLAHGVGPVRTGSLQDRVPKRFDGAVHLHGREHLFRPRLPGNCGNAPLIFVFHFVVIWFEYLHSADTRTRQLLLIDARKPVGIFGNDMEHGGKLFHIRLHTGDFPIHNGGKRLLFFIFICKFAHGLMRPLHRHLSRARAVQFFDRPLDKFGLIERRIDDDPLSFFHVHADFGEQFRIAFELQFIHGFSSVVLCLLQHYTAIMRKGQIFGRRS